MSTNLFNPSDHRTYAARWPLYRGKQLFQVIDERSKDGTEELLTVSHITGITPRKQKNVTMFQSESLVGYKICHVGDIAANTMWTWQGAIGVSSFDGVVSPAYNVYRQKEDTFNPRYLDMLLRERGLIDVYHSLSTGIRPSRLRLYPDVFLTITLPVPPREEQNQIARFLDWKISEINRLLSLKRRQISVLEECKRFLIRKTVTCGLNPDAPMKKSGIIWLGNIPSHWELVRNKTILHEAKETVGNDYSQYTLLSLTTNGVVPRDVSSGKGKFPASFDTYKIVTPGDLAFCLFDMDETPRTVGLSNYSGILTGAYTIFHVQKIANPEYICYYYTSLDDAKALRPLYSGLRKTIGTDAFLRIKAPFPPLEEQNRIVHFLNHVLSGIEKLITAKREQITAINQFKARLISDTVTGKIDVRGIEIPEYESVADESATEESSIEETEVDSDYLSS